LQVQSPEFKLQFHKKKKKILNFGFSTVNKCSISESFKSADKRVDRVTHWWLTPIILATQETEIRRIVVRSQPGQII
jgi:hypothetical protein